MAPAKQVLHILLLLLICSFSKDSAAMLDITAPCLPDQASSLLRLKRSFINADLSTWQAGTDCCHWEGVICDKAFGRVISLDLGELGLMSRGGLDPSLFNLTSLRSLSLAFNDFGGSRLPASGFERLVDIIHLNFSRSIFAGQIPIGIARLKDIATLDLSNNDGLYLQAPSFQSFMANMSNLRELHLDYVDLSSSGSSWSTVLADSVPQLQMLSLSDCGISGSIHRSFSRLRSLTSITVSNNWPGLSGEVPEYFSELSSLSTLDISHNNFEGQFPTDIFKLKSLTMLDLSENALLSVRLPYPAYGNNLQTLNLVWTNFTYDTPLSFDNLTSLKTLSLSPATMVKELPTSIKLPSLNTLLIEGSDSRKLPDVLSWIGNLTRLEALSFWGCSFSMPIPYQIGNLANLTNVDFTGSDFFGQKLPSWIGNLTKLKVLQLDGCNFSGPIPSTMENLIQLEGFQFTGNSFTGNIPKSLFALPALQVVYVDLGNQLSGSLVDIPAPLSSQLTIIEISGNQLTGPIPKSYFQLPNLKYLSLGSNKLTGTIELSSIWGLKSLEILDLSNNMISLIHKKGDTMSPPNITNIYLSSCNLTEIPDAFRYLDAIEDLDLSNNQIEGTIPSWMWDENWTHNLRTLDLSHNTFTTLEMSPPFLHMPSLAYLDLSFNRLEGRLPILVTSSENVALDYSNNNFSSIVPNFGKYLTNGSYINFSNNKLSGQIPPSICTSNNLDILDLSYNYFSGLVPSCLIGGGNLSVLKLRENKLHSALPKTIRKGCKLQTIDLNGNQIEGTLPESLKNCQSLEILDIGNNNIVGSFPSWAGTLPNLKILVLRSNQLNGTIWNFHSGHESNKLFTSLQIIDLASNNFSGYLHSEWFEALKSMMNNSNEGQILEHYTNTSNYHPYEDTITITYKNSDFTLTRILTTLKVIDFSDNSFDGPIPNSIGRLVSLHVLNMSHNNFMGQIPSQLGDLTRLESMDLSWNHLSGEIPQDLISLTSLSCLNLSYNNLTGRIPEGNQFFSFPYSSFEGNVGLCGIQVSKQCDAQGSTTQRVSDHKKSNSLWNDRIDAIIFFAFVGLGFGVGFALAILSPIFRHIDEWNCMHFCIHMHMA